MASLYRKPVQIVDPKTGEKVKAWSRKWWGRFTTADGTEKRVPLAGDRTSASAMLNELVKRVERQKVGLFDYYEEHRKRPLMGHLSDFRTYMISKDSTKEHIDLVIIRCRRIIEGTQATFSTDLDMNRVSEWLIQLRSHKQPMP